MALLDSLLGAFGVQPQSAQPSVATPNQGSVAPPAQSSSGEPTQVTVTAPHGYANAKEAQQVQGALAAEPKPQGGGLDQGLYGLMPQSWSHGTLRSILGSLGDAFLVQAGKNPEYQQRLQNQQVGEAMAGYMQNPQQAIERIAATGAPGSLDMAKNFEDAYQQSLIRKQMLEQQNAYRQSLIDAKNQQLQEGRDRIADSQRGMIGGMIAGVKTPQDYAAVYSRLGPLAERLGGDPSSVYGLPSPDEWKPGMTDNWGMTANNQAVDAAKAAQRGVSMRDTDVTAAARTNAARISAGARVATAGTGPADRAIITKAEKYGVDSLNPAQLERWQKLNYHAQPKGAASLPPGFQVPNRTGGAATPPPQAVSLLKQNPALRAQFEAKYGKGSAAQYLGK